MKIQPLFVSLAAASVGIVVAGNAERPKPNPAYKPAPPSWQAYSLNWEMFKTTPEESEDIATVRIFQDQYEAFLSMLTTTNWPALAGNLTRKSISMTMKLDALNVAPPVAFSSQWEGESWNTCPALPSLRLFFTSVKGKYNFNDANANPENYWWCCTDFGSWTLTAVDNQGAYIEASISDPHQWTDANGDSALAHTNEFFQCVSNVAQIGLSFGGNCFYDTGVALEGETGVAVLHVTRVEIY